MPGFIISLPTANSASRIITASTLTDWKSSAPRALISVAILPISFIS